MTASVTIQMVTQEQENFNTNYGQFTTLQLIVVDRAEIV